MHHRIRLLIALGLALGVYFAVTAQPGVGHPTSNAVPPHWSCRASAIWAHLAGNGGSGHVEPGAANGDATFGTDSDQCQSDDALFPNPTVNLGNDSGGAVAQAPFAQTRICSTVQTKTCVTDFSYQEKVTSSAGVSQVTLSGSGHSMSATVVRADAAGSCQNGQPVLSGSSKVADLSIDGQSYVDDGTQKVIADNPNFIVVLDEQTVGPDAANGGRQLTQRALHVKLAQDATDYPALVAGE